MVVSLVALVAVLVSSAVASADPPTTLLLCVNPGGNVTSVTPPATCGPNKTAFTTVSAAALAALQSQVTALQSQEAANVLALQEEITALQTKESADANAITALQNAEAHDATNISNLELAVTILQSDQTNDASEISALTTAENQDAQNITTIQNTLAPLVIAVDGIDGLINGLIDTINSEIVAPINSAICALSVGTTCSAITPLSHIS